jgi:hypothetical protein
LFNQLVFQNVLKYPSLKSLPAVYLQPPSSYLHGFLGLFFDCAFGLFAFAPIWMLLLPAAVVVARHHRRLLIESVLLFLPYLLLVGPRGEWHGGWSPPFRYAIVALPFVALWLLPLLADRRRAGARFLIAGLAALTLALTLLWVAVPGWTYNLAHGRNHLLDHLSSGLGTDMARFFPSSSRMRIAFWIWPPVSLAALCLIWWIPRWRSRSAATWGVAAMLLAPTLAIVAAQHLPLRIVEFEDPWVGKTSGSLYPHIWTTSRARFRGAWTLPAGGTATAPLVAGGERLDLRLELRAPQGAIRECAVEIFSGQELLVSQPLASTGEWQSLDFTDLRWVSSAPLVVKLQGEAVDAGAMGIRLDRALLDWR